MDDLKNLNPEYFEQLSLGLNIDDTEDDPIGSGNFTQEEKGRRSMAAKDAFTRIVQGAGLGQFKEGDIPGWFDTYLQLINSSWPWRVAVYVAWASSPKINRWPKTQNELAVEVLGLTSDRVIATWRKKSPDIDAMISLLQSAPMMEHRADVIKALVESASSSDHRSNPDRKLYFEMTGDFVPRQRVDLSASDDSDLSALTKEELKQMAARAKKAREDGED
jgi:hypothetical protein